MNLKCAQSITAPQEAEKISAASYTAIIRKQNADNENMNGWMLATRSGNLERICGDLDIGFTADEITRYRERYAAVVNRPPAKDTLIIGCGNLPPCRDDLHVYFIDEEDRTTYRNSHRHEDADTVDPDFARNPTLVAEFGRTGLAPIYRELFEGHKYREIIFEDFWDRDIIADSAVFTRYQDDFETLLAEEGTVRYGLGIRIYRKSAGWTAAGLLKLRLYLSHAGAFEEIGDTRYEVAVHTAAGDGDYYRIAVYECKNFLAAQTAFLHCHRCSAERFTEMINAAGLTAVYNEHKWYMDWETFEAFVLGRYIYPGILEPMTFKIPFHRPSPADNAICQRMNLSTAQYFGLIYRLGAQDFYLRMRKVNGWLFFEDYLLRKMAESLITVEGHEPPPICCPPWS